MTIKVYKVNARMYVDDKNTVYQRKGHTAVVASTGTIFRAPRLGEKIFVDGNGNGLMLD